MVFLAVLCLPAAAAWGFCPKNGLRCAFGILGGMTHEDITRTAVKTLDNEFFNTPKLTKSMKKALKEIVAANAKVDKDQKHAPLHFDGESFGAGQSLVLSKLSGILSSLKDQDGPGARQRLGQALHTIQDFYAHSNWIELGNSGANPQLGRPGAISPVSPADESTCVACSPCHGGCQSNLITPNITSGYYGGEVDAFPPISTKCRHGGLGDSGAGPGGGINKDVVDCIFSPHGFLHGAAAAAAIAATEQFIRDIHDQVSPRELKLLFGVGPTLVFTIDTTGSTSDIIGQFQSKAVQIVNDRLGTDQEPAHYVLAPFNDPFTGPVTSTDDPQAFIAAIESLTSSGGGDCPELSMTGTLQGLGASDEGADDFIFTDADAKDADLADEVSGLAVMKDAKIYPAIFGSCAFAGAAPASTRTQAASAAVPPGGRVLDAPPAAGRGLAPHPPVKSDAFTLGDPTYVRIAADSGGQRFFLQRTEAGLITELANAVARTNAVDIVAVADTLAGTPLAYSVPVDSTLTSVTFSESGLPGMALTRPDGTTVTSGDPGVTFIGLSRGVLITIANPAPGTWTATLDGFGDFSLNVSGESPLSFDAFNFVEVDGRPGHQGFFPLPGFPIAGTSPTAAAEVSGPFATAQFDLRSRAGAVVATLGLAPEPDGTPGQFFGPVSLPAAPFVTYVTGQDANNVPYQRVLGKSLPPQTVSVTPPLEQDLTPGGGASYVFTVQNFGSADTFSFSAVDDQGFVVSVSPPALSLAANASGTATVQLQVPAGFKGTTSDVLTATVVGATTGTRNFAVVDSTVVLAPPIDCSHAQASVATLWPPNHKLATVAIQGIAQPASIRVTGVLQNEPTNGLGDGDTCPDAAGLGGPSVQLRAERSGTGDGRVYGINFTATAPSGASCQGSVSVCVPHDQGGACSAATPTIDSTRCN